MATIKAGSSQTFTAAQKGQVFTVVVNGGVVASVSGKVSEQLGPNPVVRNYGPFEIGDAITIAVQSGSVTVAFGDADEADGTGERVLYQSGQLVTPGGVVVGDGGVAGRIFSNTAAMVSATPPSVAGLSAYVGPDSFGQYAEWYWNGVRWRPRSGIIAMKNTAGSVTDAAASDQDVYSIVIPAGLIGPTDDWYVDHMWTWPNSATTKNVRLKFGGTTIASLPATTTASGRGTTHVYMRDSKTAQIFSNASSSLSWQEGQTSSSGATTASIDTNSDITISLTGQWGTAGAGSNLITLERVAIGVKYAF